MGLTLLAELGFAAIQLMLGIDAPVSTLVVRDLLLKSVYAFFLGWPIYYGCAASCARRWSTSRGSRAAASRPSWGPDLMYLRSDERGPPMNNRLALRIASSAASPSSSSASSSSGSGCCRCSTAKSTWPKRRTTAPASSGSVRPRGRSSTATARSWSPTAPASPCRSTPTSCPPKRPSGAAELTQLAELTHSSLRRVREPCTKQLTLAPAAPVTLRRDVGHYLVYYLRREPAPLSRGRGAAGLRPQLPERDAGRPHPRQRRRDLRRTAQGTALQGTASRATRSARTASRTPTTATCAARPGLTQIQVDAFGAADAERAAPLAAAGPRRQPEALDRRHRAGRGRSGDGRSFGLPGGFITMDVHTGEILATRLLPDLRTLGLHATMTQAQVDDHLQRRNPAAADRPRDRRPLSDRARPSSRSPRSRRSKAAT